MTLQETIKKVKECGLNMEGQANAECENVILDALEKQIPKKPIIDTNYSGGRYTVAYCPNCKKMRGLLKYAKDFKFCDECGQALDWSVK